MISSWAAGHRAPAVSLTLFSTLSFEGNKPSLSPPLGAFSWYSLVILVDFDVLFIFRPISSIGTVFPISSYRLGNRRNFIDAISSNPKLKANWERGAKFRSDASSWIHENAVLAAVCFIIGLPPPSHRRAADSLCTVKEWWFTIRRDAGADAGGGTRNGFKILPGAPRGFRRPHGW